MSKALLVACCGFSVLTLSAQPAPELESQATGILEKRCQGCHNSQSKIAGLDLSSLQSALHGGTRGAAIKPGAPDASLLFERVVKGQMPPTAPLPAGERETLRRWIEAGAPWAIGAQKANRRGGRDWWSLQPLRVTEPPSPQGMPKAWTQSPIDRWVFAKLREMGLQPSPPASRRALIRRVTFDLLGLPPAPDEVEAFVKDESPDAYEKLIDRLLASPHYGERWARHWLDVVRFSESEGFERDWMRDNAWRYRDYVIQSFNQDKSYAQFAKEQIAGDVLEPVTHDGIVATGFLVSGPTDDVGLTSAVAEQRAMVREDQLEDMLAAAGQTFLGLTVNCARCHDHKFDPIPQKDYYRLKAVFEGVWQGDRPVLTPAEMKARDEQTGAIRGRISAIEAELAALKGQPRAHSPAPIAQWTFDTDLRDQIGSLHAALPEGAELADGRLRWVGKKDPEMISTIPLPRDLREKTLEAWIFVRKPPEKGATILQVGNTSGYRGAALDGIRYAADEKKQWENQSTARFRSTNVNGPVEDAHAGDTIHLAITYASDGVIAIYRNGKPYGAPYKPEIDTPVGRLQTYVRNDAVVGFKSTAELELDEARVYDIVLSPEQIAASYAAGAPSVSWAELTAAMPDTVRARVETLRAELTRLNQELKAIPEPVKAYAAEIKKPDPTFVLKRGDVSMKGEPVAAGAPTCVAGLSGDLGLDTNAPESPRRVKLAEWIATPANPLFSRAMANRIWHYHFGAGIVASPNDLGFNGGAPSHPELLDWLARRFIDSGWSVKKLHKEILLSQTYQQSSAYNAEAAAKDTDDRFLWRFSPQRLEGEAVRDAMLTASGTLNEKAGGPSFRPFTSEKKGSLEIYSLIDSADPELNRRTVYRMNVNSAGSPMLDALDCPLPSVKTPRRATTTTALQALSLMNSAFVVRQSKAFAARVSSDAGSDPQARIDRAFQIALGRPPSSEERAWSQSLLAEHGLQALCWGLFNATEFVYVH